MMESETYTVQEIIDNGEAYFAERDQGKGSGYVQFKRWEYNAKRLQDENGLLKSPLFYYNELERYNSENNAAKEFSEDMTLM